MAHRPSTESAYLFESEHLLERGDLNVCLYVFVRFVLKRIHLLGPTHARIKVGEKPRLDPGSHLRLRLQWKHARAKISCRIRVGEAR